jgi:hypothetical protein
MVKRTLSSKSRKAEKDILELTSNFEIEKKSPKEEFKMELPIKVDKMFLKCTNFLTKYETEEIKHYNVIYYINQEEKSIMKKLKREKSYNFDDDNGDYKLIVGEHVAYRYEITGR